jgi:hypothetical protein
VPAALEPKMADMIFPKMLIPFLLLARRLRTPVLTEQALQAGTKCNSILTLVLRRGVISARNPVNAAGIPAPHPGREVPAKSFL